MAYSLEKMFEVWDDDSGSSIEIGPDRDGLDLIEIRQMEDSKCVARITMNKDQAILVHQAITQLLQS